MVKQGDFPVMLPSPKALFAGQWRAIVSDELFQERLHTIDELMRLTALPNGN